MSHKQFSERLNNELDAIGLPTNHEERVEAFAKLIDVPRFKAQSILSGTTLPEAPLLITLANELEVDSDWLLGKKSDRE